MTVRWFSFNADELSNAQLEAHLQKYFPNRKGVEPGESSLAVSAQSFSEDWKKEGRCPKCGQLGPFCPKTLVPVCSVHGPYWSDNETKHRKPEEPKQDRGDGSGYEGD